jgi:hypothetical protein
MVIALFGSLAWASEPPISFADALIRLRPCIGLVLRVESLQLVIGNSKLMTFPRPFVAVIPVLRMCQ